MQLDGDERTTFTIRHGRRTLGSGLWGPGCRKERVCANCLDAQTADYSVPIAVSVVLDPGLGFVFLAG